MKLSVFCCRSQRKQSQATDYPKTACCCSELVGEHRKSKTALCMALACRYSHTVTCEYEPWLPVSRGQIQWTFHFITMLSRLYLTQTIKYWRLIDLCYIRSYCCVCVWVSSQGGEMLWGFVVVLLKTSTDSAALGPPGNESAVIKVVFLRRLC